MLLESYFADLEEIEAEIKTFKEMIEDTNQFISAHLDSVRNKMIRMSLFMEMGALALGSGAVVGGIFGRAANDPLVFTITAKAPTRAFSWLKAPTSAFTFKTLY